MKEGLDDKKPPPKRGLVPSFSLRPCLADAENGPFLLETTLRNMCKYKRR